MHQTRSLCFLAASLLAYAYFARAAVTAQPASGAVEGRVIFAGTPPPAVPVIEDGGSQPVLYVDRSGGLRYAVVYLPDAARGGAPPPAAVTMNQRRFVFEPQVLAVRAGQPVRFTNDDPANHNVRTRDSNAAHAFSVNTAPASAAHVHRFAPLAIGRPIALTCDIHPWMTAWVYVFEHDLFAVTTPDGSFRIPGVPAGRHRIAIRQPSAGLSRDATVDVRGGETAQVDVRFTSEEIGKEPH